MISIVIRAKKRYNDLMKRTIASVLLTSLLLTACNSGETADTEEPLKVISPRLGVAASYLLATKMQESAQSTRPSPTMGIFTSSYLAQGAFITVQAAALGIQAQKLLLSGQSLPGTSETFSLLQELGTVIQVDIVDMLNRAGNRGEALDEYLKSLKGVGSVASRKKKELEQQKAAFRTQEKEERSVVRELETELRNILRDEDYGRAASVQEQIAEAQSTLAQTGTKLDQTDDILDRYEDLLDIAEERLTAIENNREVLIAGLKVLEVPGIEDLGILNEGKSFRRRSGRRNDGEDIFGSEHINQQ